MLVSLRSVQAAPLKLLQLRYRLPKPNHRAYLPQINKKNPCLNHVWSMYNFNVNHKSRPNYYYRLA